MGGLQVSSCENDVMYAAVEHLLCMLIYILTQGLMMHAWYSGEQSDERNEDRFLVVLLHSTM